MKFNLISVFIILCFNTSFANFNCAKNTVIVNHFLNGSIVGLNLITLKADSVVSEVKHPKRTAAILALSLGMLGAHRLFLGSKPWVPLFYVLTVGGVFFILPLIDFIAILAEKDTSKFYNNNSVLMWLDK